MHDLIDHLTLVLVLFRLCVAHGLPGLQLQHPKRGTFLEDLADPDRHDYPSHLIKREDIQFSGCPDSLGAPLISCKANVCGDQKEDGRCSKMDCKCDPNSREQQLTTITTSKGDTTATGIYVLETIGSYSGLRQSITTTVGSSTSTAPDGSIKTEAAIAVIFAGGAFFYLNGVQGVAAGEAAELLDPPPSDEEHPDDPKCPEPRHKCDDCHGTNDVICKDPDAGCACEKSECPKGNIQPMCSDDKCAGNDDDKCTQDNKGCDCTPDKCPTGEKQPECKNGKCSGDNDNKCTKEHKGCECTPDRCPKGIDILVCGECDGKDGKCSAQDKKHPGCECFDLKDESQVYAVYSWDEVKKMATFFKDRPKITDDSYSTDPPIHDPKCADKRWDAPKDDKDAQTGFPSVTSAINSWCKDANGKKVGTDDIEWKGWHADDIRGFWLAARHYKDSTDPACQDEGEIVKDECIDTLSAIMDSCDQEKGDFTYGGTYDGRCLEYEIAVDASNPDNRPPWDPIPDTLNPVCDDQAKTSLHSKISQKIFKGIWPSFCKAVKDNGEDKPLEKTLLPTDYKQPWKRDGWLNMRSPPVDPSLDAYKGYSLRFYWTGKEQGKECVRDCERAFQVMAEDNCSITGIAYKMTARVGCGGYGVTIDPDVRTCTVDPSLTAEGKELVSWDEDKANKAIDEFCGGDYTVDPDKRQPPGGFSQYGTKDDGYPYQSYRWPDDSTDHITQIFVVFPETPQDLDGCAESKTFKVADDVEGCKKMLGQVIHDPDPCPGDTGGFVLERFSGHGCPFWQMFQYKTQ